MKEAYRGNVVYCGTGVTFTGALDKLVEPQASLSGFDNLDGSSAGSVGGGTGCTLPTRPDVPTGGRGE